MPFNPMDTTFTISPGFIWLGFNILCAGLAACWLILEFLLTDFITYFGTGFLHFLHMEVPVLYFLEITDCLICHLWHPAKSDGLLRWLPFENPVLLGIRDAPASVSVYLLRS